MGMTIRSRLSISIRSVRELSPAWHSRMISRLTRSALCCCIVMLPPALFSCSRFPLTAYYTRCRWGEPSQKSGMVPWLYFRYASGSGVGSTGEEKKQRRTSHVS